MTNILIILTASSLTAYLVLTHKIDPADLKGYTGLVMAAVLAFGIRVAFYGYRSFAGVSSSHRQGDSIIRTSPAGYGRLAVLNWFLLKVALTVVGTIAVMTYFAWMSL